MWGFVEDYIEWIYHGETVIVNDEDEKEYDDETIESLSQYSAELDARMDPEFGNKQGGDVGSWDGNDEGGVNNDGGARVEDEYDLEDMIRALGPEILLKSPKDLENFERVKKVSKEAVYGVEKGCPTHWTLLRFVLELLFWRLNTAGQTIVLMIYYVSCHGCCHNQTQFPPTHTKRRRS